MRAYSDSKPPPGTSELTKFTGRGRMLSAAMTVHQQITVPHAPDASAGGGAPAWVPAGAKIHIDFLGGTPQGRAWVDGTGEVAINTLLGTDANTASGWSSTLYNPAWIGPNGYEIITGNTPPAFIGIARTLVMGASGFTMRIQLKQINATGGEDSTPLVMISANGDDALQVDFIKDLSQSLRGTSFNGPLSVSTANCMNLGVGAFNVAALTIAGSRYEQAANGSSVATGVIGSTDRPAGNPLVAALIDPTHKAAIQSITIYDPLPTTAGLSALSAIP